MLPAAWLIGGLAGLVMGWPALPPPNLDWLVNTQGIAPHVPVIDKSQREDGTFSREDFTYDEAR